MDARTYIGWFAIAGTVALWAFVVLSIQTVEGKKTEFANSLANQQLSQMNEASATHLHVLMEDTKNQRAQVLGSLPTDVTAVVDVFDAAGTTVGVNVQVSNAQPETIAGAAAAHVSAVAFLIQSQGSFAQLAQLVTLISTLPIPTYIEQFNLTRNGPNWQLSARVRVLLSS